MKRQLTSKGWLLHTWWAVCFGLHAGYLLGDQHKNWLTALTVYVLMRMGADIALAYKVDDPEHGIWESKEVSA